MSKDRAQYFRDYRKQHPEQHKLYTLRRAAKLLAMVLGCTFTYDTDGRPIAVQPKDGDRQ